MLNVADRHQSRADAAAAAIATISRALLRQVHDAFGGELRAFFVGGAFTEPATLQFFYDLGILVGNGYGCTEAGTVITRERFQAISIRHGGQATAGDRNAHREPGRRRNRRSRGAQQDGDVALSRDPEMTAETIVDGWLMTGDLGRVDASGHLQLFGRKKNMIVTEEGKNIYPEDIETCFRGAPGEGILRFRGKLLVAGAHDGGREACAGTSCASRDRRSAATLIANLAERNRRLVNYKRVSGYLVWDADFPRTASLKVKRGELAEQIREGARREAVVPL